MKRTALLAALAFAVTIVQAQVVEIVFDDVQPGQLSYTKNGITLENFEPVGDPGLRVDERGALTIPDWDHSVYRFSSAENRPFTLLGCVLIEGWAQFGRLELPFPDRLFASLTLPRAAPVREPDPYEVSNFTLLELPQASREKYYTGINSFNFRTFTGFTATLYSIIVEFEGGDVTPPSVDASVVSDVLWPPNHKLVDTGLSILVEDDQDPNPLVEVFVYSDEAADAKGSGDTAVDATDDGEVLAVRSERSGKGDGRVYLIGVVATDASGNVGWDCATVTVPKSKGKKWVESVEAQALAAEAIFLFDGTVPEGFVPLIP